MSEFTPGIVEGKGCGWKLLRSRVQGEEIEPVVFKIEGIFLGSPVEGVIGDQAEHDSPRQLARDEVFLVERETVGGDGKTRDDASAQGIFCWDAFVQGLCVVQSDGWCNFDFSDL